MNQLLEDVLVLQERDQKLAHINKELARIPIELATLETHQTERVEAFEKLRLATRQIETDRRKLELEVKSKEAVIARYKNQQQSTRKNEEFAALNHEIAHIQNEITALEDQELVLMEKYETAQKELKTAQDVLKEQQDVFDKKQAELAKKQTQLQAQLAEVKERRTQAEAKVEPDLLGKYQRLYKSKAGLVVVPARHQVCSGCNMKLTSQTWLSAHKRDIIVSCDNCGRMIFCDE